MTIPPLAESFQKATYVSGAKEGYSIVSRVAKRLAAEQDGDLAGDCFKGENFEHTQAFACFTPFLNIIKSCAPGVSGCWYNDGSAVPYKMLNGDDWWNFDEDINNPRAILSNGMSIYFLDYPGNCSYNVGDGPLENVCALIFMDINGFDGPNKLGRDVFKMTLTRSGTVVPGGSHYFDTENPTSGSDYDQSCNPGEATGIGCLGRILQEGEMDY